MLNKNQILFAAAFTASIMVTSATAKMKVYSPIVEYGEIEFELYSEYVKDSDDEADGAEKYVFEVGGSFIPNLFLAAEIEVEKEHEGESYETEVFEIEGVYQLTEQGQYGWDFGLFGKLEYSLEEDEWVEAVLGPVLSTDLSNNLTFTTNLLFERELEEHATETSLNAQLKWRLQPSFEPALEVYTNDEHERYLGPVVSGKIPGDSGKFGYEAGWLAGLNSDSVDNVFKLIVEYEF